MSEAFVSAAMVFAAGLGERLRPLSALIPKPALPLPDGMVIRWPLQLVADARVSSVVVNVFHRAREMRRAAKASAPPGLRLLVSTEPMLMGTAGGLALARDSGLLPGDGPVLVVNGDSVLHLDLAALYERHLVADDLVTIALLPHLDPRRWSRVLLDHHGRVAGIRPPGDPEHTEVPFLYPGVMLVARRAVAWLACAPGEVKQQLWYPAQEQGRLGAAVVSGHWREVGTPQGYLKAALAQLGEGTVCAPGAQVSGTAILGRSFIGDGATVEEHAEVAESVVAAGATVGAGARVIRSVLLGNARAEPAEVVIDQYRAG